MNCTAFASDSIVRLGHFSCGRDRRRPGDLTSFGSDRILPYLERGQTMENARKPNSVQGDRSSRFPHP